MKKIALMTVLFGFVLVAGAAIAAPDMKHTGDAAVRDKDTFLNTIDPSNSADFDRKPLMCKGTDPNLKDTREAAVRDKDTFLNTIDPSNSADFDKKQLVMCTKGSAAGGVGSVKESLLFDIDPSSRM